VGGATDSAIVVGAHFDHSRQGLGVIDNWSGASLLPSLVESVRSSERRHTFVFAGFSQQGGGLISSFLAGSYFYAGQLDKEHLSKIAALIDFDSIGAGPTKVEHSTADARLLQMALEMTAAMKLPLTSLDVRPAGYSDDLPFRSMHVPTLLFHSVTRESLKLLHSTADNYQALKMDDYYNTYRTAAIFLAYLDVTLDVRARQGIESIPPTLQRTPE
jgi:Zn-dependent M28 family amino/carboxypeptidase